MMLTPEHLARAIGCPITRAEVWCAHLNAAMARFQIDSAARQSVFLAQVAHESGRLRWVRELWGPTPAQRGYEMRVDLGNTQPGDGWRYRGRGLIQITGRANYRRCGEALGLDLVNHPELLEQRDHAAMSAAWYWSHRGLNSLADAGDFDRITRIINGGQNGREERRAQWMLAQAVLHDVVSTSA